MIGRFLCWLTLHKWEQHSVSDYAPDGAIIVRDYAWCTRPGCDGPTLCINIERLHPQEVIY